VSSSARDWWVGVDVGGTFTDVMAVSARTSEFRTHKVLSTTGEQEVGVLAALEALGVDMADIDEIVHGHTVGINALLNRSGADAALITTRGHRDLLDIGRMDREFGPGFYDPSWLRPHQARPVIRRERRLPVHGRIGYDGKELQPLDEAEIRATAVRLREAGVNSVGICFLNSYLTPSHEERAAELVREEHPDAYIQTSKIYPVTKESERTNTVALDAYVGPIVSGYIHRLERLLRARGFGGSLWIMMMNGGSRTPAEAAQVPVFQIQSGPVGGISAAADYAKRSGNRNLVTMDVGGTSTDVAALTGGRAPLSDRWSVEHGLTLAMPVVDVTSIGSGAGSIIYLDTQGVLHVGPDSAGSTPGPACYGKGGTRPTLTDACVVMGLLQPDHFAGGRIELFPDRSAEALAPLAGQLGVSVLELASGAYDLACSDLVGSLRSVSTFRGLDLREYALLAFGAAGPMMAGEVGRALAVREIVVPPNPGQFSATGLISTDLRVTEGSSPFTELTADAAALLQGEFDRLEAVAESKIASQGGKEVAFERAIFAMYAGQTWDNRIDFPLNQITPENVPEIAAMIHAYYEEQYGYSAPELPLVITTVEVTGIALRPPAPLLAVATVSGESVVKRADVHLRGTTHTAICFHDRRRLRPGTAVPGPAVIVDPYSTIVIPAGAQARVDADASVHLTFEGEA
jgi:N-methylhydantoinase A